MTGPKYYRKKPIAIEAMQMPFSGTEEHKVFVEWITKKAKNSPTTISLERDELDIYTLEGRMIARPRDFVICGVQGELYPCKEKIFKNTYDEVKEDES